jgi:SAM-dependent methyltransferase
VKLQNILGSDDLNAIADEALLVSLLRSRAVRDLELELFFTRLRAALLDAANMEPPPQITPLVLQLCCALAEQCFINEYIFSVSDAEFDAVERLSQHVTTAITAGREVAPMRVAVLGSYRPLLTLAPDLESQRWPKPVDDLITQQVREPRSEASELADIPALTPIVDSVSLNVQRQYETNPFPRWTYISPVRSTPIEAYLQDKLSIAPDGLPSDANGFDTLIAGCGTGGHAILRAQLFPRSRFLAIDLSRASLAYARRKTREAGIDNIAYGQADVLELGSIGRSFDVIESIGVLHHLSDPLAGWRVLLSLLRDNGLMAIGLYSAAARRSISTIRDDIARRGIAPSAAEIRAYRQDLINRGLIPHVADFFNMSGCRDLLFHVMEHQFTIPQIKAFIDEHGLTFLGFEQSKEVVTQFRQLHPDPAAISDLDCWHRFELSNPRTFLAMYVFWVQKMRR